MSDHFTDASKTASFENTPETKRCSKDMISRQAAIDALAQVARETFNLSDEFNQYLAGLMDGENAIRQLPSAEPTPCDFCAYNEDCEDMRIYCPSRPLDRQTERECE